MTTPTPSQDGFLSSKAWRVALVALTVVAAMAAVAWTVTSASAMSTTFDEPHHLTTGLLWWQFGTYRWWTENPPLPKILIAALPYLAGLRLPADPTWGHRNPWSLGIELLDDSGNGDHWLTLARRGNSAFLVLALGLTFALAGGRRRPLAAFVATALVASYPPLLGHAGLATTDMAAVATVLLFAWTVDRWADRPTRLHAAAVGAALGAATLCKLTGPLFCATAAAGWLAGRRLATGAWTGGVRGPREMRSAAGTSRVPTPANDDRLEPRRSSAVPWRSWLFQLAAAGAAAFLVTWAGYRFSTGRLDDIPPANYLGTPVLPPLPERSTLVRWLCQLPLPMPELWHGALFLRAHDQHGHTAFLFGRLSEHGFWNFYLVGLLLKSPLPFLLLLGVSVAWWVRWAARRRPPSVRGGPLAEGDARTLGAGLTALGMLALSTTMTVNIGLRHVLCVVPMLALFVGRSLASPFEGQVASSTETSRASRHRLLGVAALGLCVAANVGVAAAARPELFAYFNPLAGGEPGHALIDSDLDWGQDLALLRRELRARGAPSVHYGLFAIVNPCDPEMPPMHPLEPQKPVKGWVVLSEQFYRSTLHFSFRRASCDPHAPFPFHEDPGDAFAWLKDVPLTAKVGASLRLYHLDER
jgi:hypothetical protein